MFHKSHRLLGLAAALWLGCDGGALESERRPDAAARPAPVEASTPRGAAHDATPDSAPDGQPTDAQLTDAQLTDAQLTDGQPTDAHLTNIQPTDAGPTDGAAPCAPVDPCGVRACGPLDDGCGGVARCGGCLGAGAVCAEGLCLEPGGVVLLEAAGPARLERGDAQGRLLAAGRGRAFRRIIVDLYARHGGWREDLFDRPVLTHIPWGLEREDGRSVGRYLLGLGAQSFQRGLMVE